MTNTIYDAGDPMQHGTFRQMIAQVLRSVPVLLLGQQLIDI